MFRTLIRFSRNYFLLVFLFVSNIGFSMQTLYLCKQDGINYRSITRSGTPISWNWRFNGGDIPTSVLQNPPTITYNAAGLFYTYLTTVFDNGQTFEDTFQVIVKDWPLLPFSFLKDTGVCAGAPINIPITTINNPEASYLWSTGETMSSITVNRAGTFFVNILIKAGNRTCDSVYREITITEFPLPSVNLGRDRVMCQNQNLNIDAGGAPNYKYLWTPNGEISKVINVNLPGNYKVIVTNEFGCTAEDDINLIDSCPHYIFVPNAFSPNEDRLNDGFNKVWNFTPKEYEFRIFNRWGQLLFLTKDNKESWDGNYQGKPAQQDIYIYEIIYYDTDNKWYQFRGTFFVVR